MFQYVGIHLSCKIMVAFCLVENSVLFQAAVGVTKESNPCMALSFTGVKDKTGI